MPTPEQRRDALRAKLLADERILLPEWVAYMMATTRHETAGTYAPIEEIGSDDYLISRYWNNEKLRRDLGNLSSEDAVRYKGRGFVQITGRANYKRMGGYLGIDLEGNPLKALDSDVAYEIMVQGMLSGRFTGKRLAHYITAESCDFVNARRIINGTDKAQKIADYALTELKLIQAPPRAA